MAEDLRARALAARVEVRYNGRDISADLAPYLSRFTFTDRMSGEADTLELELGQPQADASRWLADWYPDKGMEIEARFGWAHQALVPAGAFEVDEIEIGAPPLVVRLRAQATGVSRMVRTRLARAFEDTSLRAILEQVAASVGARLEGRIEPDPAIERVTQYQETLWQFAARLAREYGYVIKLTQNNTVMGVQRLADAGPALRTLRPSDITSWSYRDQIVAVPAQASVRHHDPHRAQVHSASASAASASAPTDATAADIRHLHTRASSAEQAQALAQAEMDRRALDQTSLEVSLPGDPRMAAGLALSIEGLRRIDGRYVIVQARHEIAQSGYTCALQLRKIAHV